MNTAVAIYVRKSTESEERQIQSLEDQLNVLREVAKRDFLTVTEEIVESKSAKEPGTRPEFERLVELVKKGKIRGLLVWKMDRLSRNMVDGGIIAHLLQTGKLEFIRTPEKAYRPEDSALVLAIENGVATTFIQDLSRNVKRGLNGKAERGWLPGRAPFGYVNNVVTKEIDPDPSRFLILQRGWELLASNGYTISQVRRELNEIGLGGTNGKRGLTNGTAYKMFSSRFYIGEFLFRGEWRTGKHRPMVNLETFEKVQVAIGNAPKSRDPEVKHPYAGIFECPACGCRITAETKVKTYKTTGVSRSYSYYRCTGAKGCAKSAVTGHQLDSAASFLSERIKISAPFAKWMRKEIARSAERSAIQEVESEAALKIQVRQFDSRLERLTEMRIDQELTAQEYGIQRAKAIEGLNRAKKQLLTMQNINESVDRSIVEKIDLLEQANGWEAMGTTTRRGYLRSFAQKCFLTLERLEFYVDPVMHKIVTFEPGIIGSQRLKTNDLDVLVFDWQAFAESIRTLQKDLLLPKLITADTVDSSSDNCVNDASFAPSSRQVQPRDMKDLICISIRFDELESTPRPARDMYELPPGYAKSVPLGYLFVRSPTWGDYLKKDPATAPVIEEMFVMRHEGKPFREIIQFANERGLRSKQGKVLGFSAVYYILNNRTYEGLMKMPDGEWRLGRHDALNCPRDYRGRRNRVPADTSNHTRAGI